MKHFLLTTVSALLLASSAVAADAEWRSLFDGKTLNGWSGDPQFWSIKDGCITGITTKETPTKGNTFILHTGSGTKAAPEEFGDFVLEFEYRIVDGNSGMQVRSFLLPGDNDGWRVGGYQSDFDASRKYAGIIYGEKFRGILCHRGKKTVLSPGQKGPAKEVEQFADNSALKEAIKDAPEWNTMRVEAKDFRIRQWINDTLMADLTDNDEPTRRAKGLIALQLHQGPPMTIQMRNVRIKTLGQ